jgi:tetratricopeptide (TPR) repeat protein
MLVIGEQAFPKMILLQALVFQSALEYLEKAGSSVDIFEIAYALRQSTNILLALGKAKDAKSNYEHWLRLIDNQNGLDGKVTILTDYSYLLAHIGLRRDAEKNILRAVNLIGPEHEMSSAVLQAFLEVRENNLVAQEMYRKFGYENTGRRKRYYKDNDEDAILMTLSPLNVESFTSDV